MSKPRLAVVVKYFPPYPRISGILTFVSLLASEMGRAHDVHVVTAALPKDTAPDETGETVPRVEVHRVGWPFPFTSAVALRRLRPDVILTVSGIYDLRAAAAYFAPGSVLAPRSATPFFYQATWPAEDPNPAFRLLARRYAGLAAASPRMAERFTRAGLASETIAPAVDVKGLRAIASAERGTSLRVGFVNHLNEVKGADIASSVISRLAEAVPDMEFVIAGVGDLEPELRQRHGTDRRVTFAGFLPERERLEVLASCDVMLLPFRQGVSVLGVSQTALEVMALGNVVVGTVTDALDEAVVDGRNGILLDPAADVEASMVEAVLSLERDRELLHRLRTTAAADAAERWDIARRATEVPALLGLPAG